MSERSDFEQVWGEAFNDTEMTPSMSVWSNVRAELSTRQAKKQSGLVIYWRWMAAASVALLIAVGLGSFYYSQSILSDYQILAEQEQRLLQDIVLLEEERCEEVEQANLIATDQSSPLLNNKEKVIDKQIGEDQLMLNSVASSNQTIKNSEKPTLSSNAQPTKSIAIIIGDNERTPILSKDHIQEAFQPTINITATSNDQMEEELAIFKTEKENASGMPIIEPMPTELLAQFEMDIQPKMVPDMLEILKMQNGIKQNFRGMWAGISLGGGSFESNINRGESETLALTNLLNKQFGLDGEAIANTTNVNQEVAESPAFSYAFSANFGKQIGNRTFLQGGVEYSRYSSGTTSNVVINDANNNEQSFLRFENTAALDQGTLNATDTYKLANNVDYLAIPLNFGYQLLKRKIGISLSSGVSTNFFLKNTLKDKSGIRSDVEVTNGVSSPYKPLSLNGLFGAEISYQWNEHYQLAIVPDYRISLDGTTKTDAFIQSNPTAFFLGFRFKYILK